MYLKVLYAIFLSCVVVVQSARILGIIHTPSYSHQIVFRPLWKALSLKGHQLTVLTTDPMNDAQLTNLTEIDMHDTYSIWGNFDLIKLVDIPVWWVFYNFSNVNAELVEKQLTNLKVKKLLEDENEKYDLLIIEGLPVAHYAFAEKFRCPLISVLSLDANAFVHREIGNPTHFALHPDYMISTHDRLTFTERLSSMFFAIQNRYVYKWSIIPAQQRLVEKYFGKNYSKIEDVFKNYSAFFLNINYLLHPIRPLLPNVVQIGGNTHFTGPKPLPTYLQHILDNSTQGVIYFSLGSNAKSKNIKDEVLQTILEVFNELPYTVLWKFENDTLPNKPRNVIIAKWFPQQDILCHPNIKLFITQGGLQSFEEALYANVPMIGIPILGDQRSNVQRFVSKGLGLLLEYNSITKESFKFAIQEVIINQRFRETVKMYANLLKEQSQTGLERAIWWTEYVLKHKGAPHLRNPELDLPWYQYYLLDLIAFCFTLTLVFVYLLFRTFLILLRLYHCILFQPKVKVQ